MPQQSKFLNQVLQTCLRMLHQQQRHHQHQRQPLIVTKTMAAAAAATATSTRAATSKSMWQFLCHSAAATCATPMPCNTKRAAQPPLPPPARPSADHTSAHRATVAAATTMHNWRNSFLGGQPAAQSLARAVTTASAAAMQPQRQGSMTAMAVRTYSKFTSSRDPTPFSGGGVTPLCEDRANDLISNLKDSERAAIKLALEKYDAMRQKEGFEGKLAATQWRTRFGRLSKVPALGDVDPTGTFCAFPDDWLKKKAAEKAIEPSKSDLVKIFFVNAVPFVAFGFLDNFTMIIAGDYIEQLFGVFMCISTMAAAGLGNTISDILGIGSAYYVERGCELLGLKPPDLTPVQMEMKSSRRSANYGRMIGITVGCLIGMVPLLFMEKKTVAADENAVECVPIKDTSVTTKSQEAK